jgi:glucokinase
MLLPVTQFIFIMNHHTCIGIDIGGTNLRVGVVCDHRVVQQHTEPITTRDPDALGKHLAKVIRHFSQEHRPFSHVGIGLPGIVDFTGQRVLRSPHFPEWVNVPFGALLTQTLGLPVRIDNDANMILRGEMHSGAAKGLQHAIMITLGTGIGGALLIHGKIFHGNSGFAGEVGHMVIDRHGPPCACGGRGCWELYASSQAFSAAPHTVQDAKLWDEFGTHVGIGIASLVNVLGIEDIIIGGGLSNAWAQFEHAMHREIPKRTYIETASRIRVHRAQLGDTAGVLGAAAFSGGPQ